MGKISNDPRISRRVTYSHILWHNAFNETELNNIETLCDREDLVKATTVGQGEDCEEHRRSILKFIDKNEENHWIFDRFNSVIERINDQFYGFDLIGYKSFQYTIYDSSNKGMYEWHMDTVLGDNLEEMWPDSTRKLTLVMLMAEPYEDFTGGEFQLNLGFEANAITPNLRKGDIIAFPSFMIHRVKPVLLGKRKSIVIWVEGPKFR